MQKLGEGALETKLDLNQIRLPQFPQKWGIKNTKMLLDHNGLGLPGNQSVEYHANSQKWAAYNIFKDAYPSLWYHGHLQKPVAPGTRTSAWIGEMK